MGDYNIAKLPPREFEHMVQALAFKCISPGVTPYGDGPDGGREATYRGPMNYRRATTANWDGYLVIQAKSKQYPPDDIDKARKWVRD